MKERHWIIKTSVNSHYVIHNGSRLFVDGREIEIPVRTGVRSGSIPIDFQLPFDEISCWCRFTSFSKKYLELYVNGEIVYDLDKKIYVGEGLRNKRAYWLGLFVVGIVGLLLLFLVKAR